MTSVGAAGPRFFVPEQCTAGESVTVGEEAARHMRVLRLAVGAQLELLDGQGQRAHAVLRTLTRRSAIVDVHATTAEPRLPAIHLIVPVADRERSLMLAEKAAEFGVSSWRPVHWRRSRSVAPRGEGAGFQLKVRARMVAAMEQSGSAWLPALYPDARPEHAVAALPAGMRIVLEGNGAPLPRVLGASPRAPLTIALGPEGGFEALELDALVEAGFVAASLGPTTLRFETAGIGALACARAITTEQESVP